MGEPPPVVTVDGPSGTGKGTLSRRLAARLRWHFLDSGALYRIVALAAARRGVDDEDEAALEALAADLAVEFANVTDLDQDIRVLLEGQDVSGAIRTESCGAAASKVAAMGGVRRALLGRQRAFRQAPGLVADGRDMGTVVFPQARLKLFLTASQDERAGRRYNQLKEKGIDVSLPQLKRDIAERDRRDSERSVSPLRPAPDAVIIDTTDMAIDAVTEHALHLVHERGLGR